MGEVFVGVRTVSKPIRETSRVWGFMTEMDVGASSESVVRGVSAMALAKEVRSEEIVFLHDCMFVQKDLY